MARMQEAALARGPARGGPRRLPSFGAQALLVLRKDLTIEARTGEVVVTSSFFAVLLVVLASLSLFGGPGMARVVASGVIWLSITFAAVLALGRTWQREREEGALDGLLVAPLSRSALFVGKLLGILIFLCLISLVVIPLTALFFSLDLGRYGGGLACIALAALPGVAAAGTLFGSMTVRTGARDLLLAIVLFPLLSPTLLSAVAATRELLGGAPLVELTDFLRLMVVFDIVFTAGGLALFGTLVER
jgi:heme exporter protein B